MSDDLSDIYGQDRAASLSPAPLRAPSDQHMVPSLAKVLALEARIIQQEQAIARLQAEVNSLKVASRQRSGRAPVRIPLDAEQV